MEQRGVSLPLRGSQLSLASTPRNRDLWLLPEPPGPAALAGDRNGAQHSRGHPVDANNCALKRVCRSQHGAPRNSSARCARTGVLGKQVGQDLGHWSPSSLKGLIPPLRPENARGCVCRAGSALASPGPVSILLAGCGLTFFSQPRADVLRDVN